MDPELHDALTVLIYMVSAVATGLYVEWHYRRRWRREPDVGALTCCAIFWPIFWAAAIFVAIAWVISELD